MRPMTYFTGIGFDSTNSAENSGRSLSCIDLADATFPFIAFLTRSDMSAGQQLLATEITPSAPMQVRARVSESSPLRTSNPFGRRLMMSWIWAMLPLASLTPSMPSTSARRMSVSAETLDPVLPGML